MVVAFFAISLYTGVAAYYSNFSGRGAYDAGIVTQAVASATFHHSAPFYESADCQQNGRCSFLLVHPGFVLYVVLPLYSIAPTMITLFGLRSLVVALAAIPLYRLTRRVTDSQGKGLLAAGLYLLWAPTLGADLISLHLESLFPLEFFTLAALWQERRFRWGLLTALIAFLTFEITPIFVFLVGVFFLIPWLQKGIEDFWRSRGEHRPEENALVALLRRGLAIVRQGLRLRDIQYTLALMGASVVAYVALTSFMNVWGPAVLGVASPAVPSGLSGVFYNKASHPVFDLGVLLTSPATLRAAEFWLILYALVGFIPLLAPRTLVIAVPWIGWTFLQNSDQLTGIGHSHQYTMIAAVPVFIGLAYGLRHVRLPSSAAASERETSNPEPPRLASPNKTRSWRRHRVQIAVWTTVLVAVIAANALLSPIDPALPDLGVSLHAPFSVDYFYNPFSIPPGFEWTKQLVSVIPENASVLAATSLFPLVANLPKSIELISDPTAKKLSHLPFNLTNGPDFFLMDLPDLPAPGTYLGGLVSDPARYGLRGFVGSTGDGPVLLYEQGYFSAAERFGPVVNELNATYSPGHGLDPEPISRVVANASSPSGEMIVIPYGNNRTGPFWTESAIFLPPGHYSIRSLVTLVASNGKVKPGTGLLRVSMSGYSGLLNNTTWPASQFSVGTWTTFALNLTAINPIPELTIRGLLLNTNVQLAVAAVEIVPSY